MRQQKINTIARTLDTGANIIAVQPDGAMTKLSTHPLLQASTAMGALMKSTVEAKLEFKHDLRNAPSQMFKGHVLPTLARHTII